MADDKKSMVPAAKPGDPGYKGDATDPIAAINAQTQANRPNINTPFAQQQWTKDANGNWTLNAGLSPGMQGVADTLQHQAADAYGQPLDNGSAARNQAINAAYGQATSRLDPQFAQQDQLMASRLANQGLDPTSEAYRTAMGDYGRQKNDAYTSAMASAIQQGTLAGHTAFMDNLSARNAPMQELGGLSGFMGMPAFNPATGYADAAGQAASNQADQIAAAMQLAQAASSAYRTSDERLKEDIDYLPMEAIPGVPLATFNYAGHPEKRHLGVIAQDVEKVAPGAVAQGPDGYKMVDYAALGLPAPGEVPSIPGMSAHKPPPDMFGGATPEQVHQLMALGLVPDEMEHAHHLQTSSGVQHRTGIAAALGGMADLLNAGHGRNMEAELRRQQLEGRSLYADLLRRQGGDGTLWGGPEQQMALAAALRNGGGGGGY